MQTSTILTAVSLVALTAMSAGAAQRPRDPAPSPLYALDKAPLPKGSRPLLPNIAEEFLIQVDPADVAANPPAFLIELPDRPLLKAIRTRFFDYRPDWKSWFGSLRYASGDLEAGSIHVGYHGAQISAQIDFEGERFEVIGGAGESQRLVRLDTQNAPPSCGLEASAPASEETPVLPSIPRRQQNTSTGRSVTKLGSIRIDVLAVYPRAFFSQNSESDLYRYFYDSLSYGNSALDASGVDAFFNPIAIVPLVGDDQPPATGVNDAHRWLNGFNRQPPAPTPTEVVNLRNAFGADVVTIVVPPTYTSDFPCGVANLPRANNTFYTTPPAGSSNELRNEAMGDRTFTAVRAYCGESDYTLAHEIGHNFGLFHDDNSDAQALSPVGYGYLLMVDGQQRATMMGCTCGYPKPACAGTENVCNRIRQFSNPARDVVGFPGLSSGDAQHNEAAAITAQLQPSSYVHVPDLRPVVTTNSPPNAAFSVSCTGRTCTFNANASIDNEAIPANNYWWDFGDNKGIVNGGSVIPRTYDTAGLYRVHLVVKDSGGQTHVTWSDVTVQALPRDARIASQSVPATMVAGQSYQVSITLQNVGTLSWSPIGPQCNAYRLGSANPYNNGTFVPATRVELPAPVAPGGQVMLNFNVTAPSTAGTYNFQWQMVQECVTWFGDFSPNVAVTVQAAPRDAQFISVSVPTTMTAGQVYPVSVTVKNTGTLTWSPIGPQCNAYRLGLPSPNGWSPTRVDLQAPVPPGGQVTLNFNLTAPAASGTYKLRWQMVQECVVWFGPLSPDVWVNVQAAPPIYQGYHDIGNCRDIYGWARDANSSSSINVNIYRDGSYDATVPANLFRQDLYNAGIGTGYYGFDYVPSNSLWRNGQWHSATVRFPSGANLNTTPKSLICNLSMFPGLVPQENNPTGGTVYSVATQFSSNYNGYIKEIGFYRGSGETGSNTIHLTTDSGADLAVRTPACGPSGWCWASLSPSVAITAGTRYRVWVNTNTYQVKTGCGIGGGITSQGVLNAISGFWVAGNTFPTNGSCSNFFVDVKFDL